MKLQSELNFLKMKLHNTNFKITRSASTDSIWIKSKDCEITENFSCADAEIRGSIENECQLFFKLGIEINTLLRDAYEKDKQLLNQKELILLLSETVKFFYFKLKEIQVVSSKYLGDIETGCRKLRNTKIRHYRETLETFQGEMDTSLIKIKQEMLKNLHGDGKNTQEACIGTSESLYGPNLQSELERLEKEIATLTAENQAQRERINGLQEVLRQNGIENPYPESLATQTLDSLPIQSIMQKRSTQSSSTETWSTPDTNIDQMEECCPIQQRGGPQTIPEFQEALAKAQREREIERAKRNQEVVNLKQTILELEKALRNAQIRSDSLQKAVDLYQNSVNVLEASEERSRIEISQQRQTISNLQEALVVSKNQLEELQQKTSSEIHTYVQCINNLRNILLSMDNQCLLYYKEVRNLNDLVEHLRDTNLDVEVENFGYVQDVAMLETRLLKYQHICKSNEDCICGMKNELMQLRSECGHQIKTNDYLKQQLMSITCEFNSIQNEESESKELQQMLQRVNEELQHQADITQQELIRETKINDINAERIEELQQIVGEKTLELNRTAAQYRKTQKQLDAAIQLSKELRAELSQLQCEINNCREATAVSEERCGCYQKEIEDCKCTLAEVSNKFVKATELLHQKNEQYGELEKEYCVQNNTLTCLQKQIGECRCHYENDVADLKHTIQELSDKLTKTENNYHALHEDYKRSQAQIIEATQQQNKIQRDNVRHEKEYTETMQTLQNEESRLSECVCQLETECGVLRNELLNKERQMGITEEENVNLKNEINKIVQRYTKLKAEHEKVLTQSFHLRDSVSRSEHRSHLTDEQLNHCLCNIQSIQAEKSGLEMENKVLKDELNELQVAYKDLEQNYRLLNESVVTLESKLLDHKMSRNEICVESRTVIANVQAWLKNQNLINEQLTQKLRDDEIIIDKLKQQLANSRSLRHSCCKKCKCKSRQRGGGLDGERSLRYVSTRPNQRLLWSPVSQGSGSVSPASIISNTQDWYTYEEFAEDDYVEEESLLSHCLQRVESINQELQKSNRFWQSKMVDHEYIVTRDQ